MSFRLLLLAFCCLGVVSVVSADIINDGSLRAKPTSDGIVLSWSCDDESNVQAFLIERSTSGSDVYVVVCPRLQARGAGVTYEYHDDTAFRTNGANYYRYRITPLDGGGNAVGPGKITGPVLSSVGSVRRTWGSIKALFR